MLSKEELDHWEMLAQKDHGLDESIVIKSLINEVRRLRGTHCSGCEKDTDDNGVEWHGLCKGIK